ncbi:MAG: hypothetical protein K2M95_02555, partial [Clostridiales bacterium]|nr:hypothetical protein [Clostridiales bacterium]
VNTSRVIASTYGGSKTNEATREGNGQAVITDLTKCATQSAIPTFTLTRHETKTVTFAGTSSDTSLLGVDPASLALSAHTNAVYQVNGIAENATQETLRARTWADTEKADAAANSWLTYSFTTNGVTLQAKRYWTGTKAFFIRVKNTHGSPSWFRFNASVEGGELKKDTNPTGDFKFGKSTTQVPTEKR